VTTATPTETLPVSRANVRRPEIMDAVHAEVEQHYRSQFVEALQHCGGLLEVCGLKIRLAKTFGFCYGVQRAIDLAYAARKVFSDRSVYILGEIVHNPEVNEHLVSMGIQFLSRPLKSAEIDLLTPRDVVIVPAFGSEFGTMQKLRARGCQVVDTTCADVMNVWKRVRQNAKEQFTSIVHGKIDHEETKATISRAATSEQSGHYLVIFNLAEADRVCHYIRHGGDMREFLTSFAGKHSLGFNPDRDLRAIGVVNQTTMLRSETEEIQRRLNNAIADRYGAHNVEVHYRSFDTICGATQDRQDSVTRLLLEPLDMMLVVGGFNSSNTLHLAEISSAKVPCYFIRNAKSILSASAILHFNIKTREEVRTANWLPNGRVYIGVTAGASCPGSLIEAAIIRLYQLRGVAFERLLAVQHRLSAGQNAEPVRLLPNLRLVGGM
jgi:4-hydroxy-3-methylbut-2-en-1-yl diphosphate reductase